MDFIQNFRPTCKAQLLQVALWYHKGDVEKAQQMVDFYVKNMELPDYEPQPMSWQENTKNTVNGLMEWLKENRDTLESGVQFVRDLMGKTRQSSNATPLPEIN